MVASFHTAPSLGSTAHLLPPRPASPFIPAQRVSVLIVDDQPQVRQGLRALLEFYGSSSSLEFSIAGEAATYAEALKQAAKQPALILMNLELAQNQENSIATLKRLREFYQGKVLVLSGHREDDLVFQAMQAGASGYIVKDRMAAQLCIAISVVLANQIYLASEGMTQFFRSFRSHHQQITSVEKIHLSDREREVLTLLVEGDPNARIAERLYITVATVKAHLTSIFEKLGVKSRSQAIVTALKLNLV